MPLSGVRRRIERLERRIKGGECDGCTRTAIKNVEARAAARKERPDGNVDWSSIQRAPCPDCGNPNPRIPMWLYDKVTERMDRRLAAEKALRERDLKQASTNGTDPESESDSNS
jgi:hypothetical protein